MKSSPGSRGRAMGETDPGRFLERRRREVDRYLHEQISRGDVPLSLQDAMHYSLAAGGKRLRPLLALAAAETLGYPGERLMPVAAALELVHTYSLIHDDLPAMDDSALRRGRSTSHRVFGEALAILAGDALLTLAFEQVARYGLEENKFEQALLVSAQLARASGREGMVGGQVLDLQSEGREVTLAELERIDRSKTGALLQAAVRSGAIAAGATTAEMSALDGYSSSLGLAFQIVDDLLDRESGAAELGKDSGADEARGKATFPALLGAEAARKRSEELYRRALEHLGELGRPAGLLEELARQLVFRIK